MNLLKELGNKEGDKVNESLSHTHKNNLTVYYF